MRAKFVNEDIKFERGKEPKTVMGLGDPTVQIVNAVKEVAKRYDVDEKDVDIDDSDPRYFSAGFSMPGAYVFMELNPTYDKQFIVGSQDDEVPADEREDYDTIEEAKDALDHTCGYLQEQWEEREHYCEECGEEIDNPDYCPYCEEDEEDIDESVKFERTREPMKGLNVGRDRKLPKRELEKVIMANIWPRISDDVHFLGKVSGKEELRQELEQWIEIIVDEFQIERPSELGYVHFKEYWDDIFNE